MAGQTQHSSGQAKGKGCFFYGCLTLVIVIILGGLAAFFGVRYAGNKLVAALEQYTDTAPTDLPEPVQLSSSRLEELQKRVADFKADIEGDPQGSTLTLTAEEINALVNQDADWQRLKNKVFFNIQNDKLTGQLSLPLDFLAGIPFLSRLQDRYLNGSATLDVSLRDGRLVAYIESLEVKGQQLPSEFLTELRKQNLAKDIGNDPKVAQEISKLRSIEIQDGKVIIQSQSGP